MDKLLKCIEQIKQIGEYLARGNEIETLQDTIVFLEDEVVSKRKVFSLVECDIVDELEQFYYGEQHSITVLIKMLIDKEYMPEWEISKDPLTPMQQEIYDIAMKRLKEILKQMSLKLMIGIQIPIDDLDIDYIKFAKEAYQDEAEIEEEQEEYDYDEEEENEEAMLVQAYLTYDAQKGEFVITRNDEIILDQIKPNLEVMKIYSNFLEKVQKNLIYAKNTGTKINGGVKYKGISIEIDNRDDSR